MKSPLQRLLSKIDIRQDNECWPWKASVKTSGYGQFWLYGEYLTAQRAVAILLKGEDLERGVHRKQPLSLGAAGSKREIRHLCNNKLCCNPAHLIYGNHSENTRDCIEAGTHKSPFPQKLTSADYAAILASSERTDILAKRFGISGSQIKRIRAGEIAAARSHVLPPESASAADQ